jgi:hypothetical protein
LRRRRAGCVRSMASGRCALPAFLPPGPSDLKPTDLSEDESIAGRETALPTFSQAVPVQRPRSARLRLENARRS